MPARAQSSLIPTMGQPFVWIQLERGNVTVHSWNRPQISLIADPSIRYYLAAPRVPQQIPLWSATVETQTGPLTLPSELFPLPEFAPGEHEAFVVRGSGDVTLFVPAQTPLVVASVQAGSVTFDGYVGTAFVARVNHGGIHVARVDSTAAVQDDDGTVIVNNSNFPRLRLRTARGDALLSACRAAQIQVTSLTGNLLYDDGVFYPGLAHFESVQGNIAIGLAAPAQIEANSGVGRVYDMIGGGGYGPVVTAASTNGAVMTFHGSIRFYPQIQRLFAPRANIFAVPPYRV